MEIFLTYVGSIASIASIPLGIYFYFKTKEENRDKVRRQILQIISYQIGENRKLDEFEINKVINSNLRIHKLTQGSITMISILEDLISETISSPLLDSSRKDTILKNIKDIFPNPESENATDHATAKFSTIFAIASTFILILTMSVGLIIGESNWNSDLDWWFSFNLVKGFWPNILVSALSTILGILIAFWWFKKMSALRLSRKTKANTG